MTVTVITSVYGSYDQMAEPAPQDVDCEWILVADLPVGCWPWKTIVEPRPWVPPRLAAKVAKCRPDLYAASEVTVWVDGHVRITHPGFVRWATAPLADGADVAQLAHPQRRHIGDEAAVSARLPKYAGLPVGDQVAHYLEGGYPDGWGLWAAGIIARRDSPPVRAWGQAWLAEQVRWGVQDQLSEAPLLWRFGLKVATLDGPLIDHWAFRLDQHADGSQ